MMRCGLRNLDACQSSLLDHIATEVHNLVLACSPGCETGIPLAEIPVNQDLDRLTDHGQVLSQGKLILQCKNLR